MAPPLYADLGKSARDIFNRGYNLDTFKLDVKTKTKSGVEFSSGGTSHLESGKVLGNIETKYNFKEYGLTFTEKWNTNNILSTEVVLKDMLQGVKLTAESAFSPHTGDRSVCLKSEFKNDLCAVNCETNFKTVTPLVNAAAVFGYKGWLCGYQMKFDCKDNKLKANNVALGYSSPDFVFHTNFNDGKVFNALIYQKVNSSLESGVEMGWLADNNDAKLALGCKYTLDNDSSVRAKVNNLSQIGLGYSQKIRDGVTLSLSMLIDGKNFNQGGHKVGLALELEA